MCWLPLRLVFAGRSWPERAENGHLTPSSVSGYVFSKGSIVKIVSSLDVAVVFRLDVG